LCGGDEASVRLGTLLLMTFPGAACLFQGDEIGQEGGMPDYDTRRPFPWDRPELWRPAVLDYHKELIALRKAHRPLRRGTYHALYADDDVYVFARRFSGEVLLVGVNAAEQARTVVVPVEGILPPEAVLHALYPAARDWGSFADGRPDGHVHDGCVTLTLAARSGVIAR
jgi:glycosidase